MSTSEKRPLKVFLCHARDDKVKTRDLYRNLRKRGIQPWLDAEDLVAGQDWRVEIPKAIKASDAIIICLSKNSINKEGFVQAEITFALEKALEIPQGRIFIIPARLEDCEVPNNLERFHWVDLFEEDGFPKLMKSLRTRARQLERVTVEIPQPNEASRNLTSVSDEKVEDKAAHEKVEHEAAERVVRERVERDIIEKEQRVDIETSGNLPKLDKLASKTIKAPNKSLASIVVIILVLCVSAGFIVNLFAQNIFTPQQTSTQTAQNPTSVIRTAAAELTLTSAAFTATLLPTETTIILPTKAFTSTLTPSGSLDSGCNNSIYVSDVTIPDNTVLSPNQQFVKTWRIQNTGTCTWTSSYMINNVSGDKMRGQGINLSENVLPGNSMEVSVTLIAPNTPGTYQDVWQLQDDNGVYFGAIFTVIIKVQ